MTSAYSSSFDEAVALAVDAFRPILRKSTRVPYITHLFAVTALVGENGGDEEQMIAAMLHDYLEDIPGATAAELERRFGARVTRIVVALSDTMEHPKPPWRERKEAYLAVLAAKPAEIKLVCAADKLHNCRCIVRDVRTHGPGVFERFRGRHDGTLWYYAELVRALGVGWSHPLLDELREAVAELQTL